MRKIKCLIVEDEELARDLLEKFIGKIPYLELAGKCENPVVATEIMEAEKVDLLFLDIQMPKMTGLEFLKILPEKPQVVLTTAYADYALEGYELEVTDYLLKPFSFERFVQAVNKAARMLQLEAIEQTAATSEPARDFLLVNSEHKLIKIPYADIDFIEGMREYVAYHTSSQGRILSLRSLKSLEAELPPSQFIRIHKSYIINSTKVKALEGNLLHLGDKKLPIGASYREQVLARVFK